MLTDAQKQTLVNALRNETDQAVVGALAIRNDVALAAWLNAEASPAFAAWKTAVSMAEIMKNGMDWTRVDNLSVGKARIWEWMFQPDGVFNPSKPTIRAGIEEVWRGTAADLAVRDTVYGHCRRNATRLEKLFATGAGTTAAPGLFGVEGAISVNEVSEALNRF